MLRDVCMHIAARNPVAGQRGRLPRTSSTRKRKSPGPRRPPPANQHNLVDMIAQGKLKTWFADNVLLEQPFVKDDSKSVGDLLKASGFTLVRFLRYKVGA